jgi:hypothetical protein
MWTIQQWQVSFDVLVIFSRWKVQKGLYMLTMRFNFAQAIVEVIAFTSSKLNPTIVNPFTHKFGKSSMHHNCHPIHLT